jgi:hypothetical protein
MDTKITDFKDLTIEELETLLQENKDKLTKMVLNRDLTQLIVDIEVIEFTLKTKKDGQKDPEHS